jgi:ABC-2 type transport system permease protein
MSKFSNSVSDALIITKRQILQLTRVPELLIFSTIQPVMFVLLFRYVFGGSIETGQPGGYVQLLMPGIFVQTVAFTLAGTAVGLSSDMQKGLIDRFRSLPISRSAVVFGRTLGDAALNIVVLLVMGIAGYLVGLPTDLFIKCICANNWNAKISTVLCRVESRFNDGRCLPPIIWFKK